MFKEIKEKNLEFICKLFEEEIFKNKEYKRDLEKIKFLLEHDKLEYAILNMWNIIVYNLQSKLEYLEKNYIRGFFKKNKITKNDYNENYNTISERWQKIKSEDVINLSRKLKIIKDKNVENSIQRIQYFRNYFSEAHKNEKNDINKHEKILFEDFKKVINNLILNNVLFEKNITEKEIEIFVEDSNKIKNENFFNDEKINYLIIFSHFYNTIHEIDINTENEEENNSNYLKITQKIKELEKKWNIFKDEQKQYIYDIYFDVLKISNISNFDDLVKNKNFLIFWRLNFFNKMGYLEKMNLFIKIIHLLKEAKQTWYSQYKETYLIFIMETIFAENIIAKKENFIFDIFFEEIYETLLSVYCGNKYRPSDEVEKIKKIFIDILKKNQKIKLINLFRTNSFVQHELEHEKPNKRAIELVQNIFNEDEKKEKEIFETINFIESLKK